MTRPAPNPVRAPSDLSGGQTCARTRRREGDLFGERATCLFGLAAQLLGWRPHEFWAATPVELAWAMRDGDETVKPVSSDEITELLVRFPDGVR